MKKSRFHIHKKLLTDARCGQRDIKEELAECRLEIVMKIVDLKMKYFNNNKLTSYNLK